MYCTTIICPFVILTCNSKTKNHISDDCLTDHSSEHVTFHYIHYTLQCSFEVKRSRFKILSIQTVRTQIRYRLLKNGLAHVTWVRRTVKLKVTKLQYQATLWIALCPFVRNSKNRKSALVEMFLMVDVIVIAVWCFWICQSYVKYCCSFFSGRGLYIPRFVYSCLIPSTSSWSFFFSLFSSHPNHLNLSLPSSPMSTAITSTLFHSKLKTYLFRKSFSP